MITIGGPLRKLVAGSVLLGATVASYVAVSIWRAERREGVATSQPHVENAGPRVNPFASANGTDLIAFVIAASDCGWSRQPATMETVGRLREALRSAHGREYAQVSVVGVALDKDLHAGLRFLAALARGRLDGAFDQVILGGSWLNEQVVRFVWRERVTRAAIPQIVVIERPVNTESYLETSTIGIQSDRLVANPMGSTEIVRWVRKGLPLVNAPFRVDSLHGSIRR